VMEPGRAFSAARSAMISGPLAYAPSVSLEVCSSLRQVGIKNRR
jgi:hypothetical protein